MEQTEKRSLTASTAMGIVWPVDREARKLVGEESYTGGDGFAGIADRKIDEADIAALRI